MEAAAAAASAAAGAAAGVAAAGSRCCRGLRYCRGSRYAVRFATCGRACGTVPFVWPAVRGAACSAVGTACGSRRAAVGAACSAVGASCGSRRAVGRAVRLRWCGLRFAALRAVLSVRPAVRGVRLSVAVGAACGLRFAACGGGWSESSARCVPRLSVCLAFYTAFKSGARKALQSGQSGTRLESSARCVPRLSVCLAFYTAFKSGAPKALLSGQVEEVGRIRAPGVNLDCRFDLLLTRGPNRVHRRRWCRAESRYARRNRLEASARCEPRSSFWLGFNTGCDLGARRALLSGRVAICEAEYGGGSASVGPRSSFWLAINKARDRGTNDVLPRPFSPRLFAPRTRFSPRHPNKNKRLAK